MLELRHFDRAQHLGHRGLYDLRQYRGRRILIRLGLPRRGVRLTAWQPGEAAAAGHRRGGHPGELAHLAVAHLPAVSAEQSQQQHAEHAQRREAKDAGADQLGVLAHRGGRLARLRVDRAGAGLGGRAGGRDVVPADLRVSDRQGLGVADLGLGDEGGVRQRVVDALVARAGADVEQHAAEAGAGTRGHREVGRLAVRGAGEGERGQVGRGQLRGQHRVRAHARHPQPAAVAGVGGVAGHLRQLQVGAGGGGVGVGDARARAGRGGLGGQRLGLEGRRVHRLGRVARIARVRRRCGRDLSARGAGHDAGAATAVGHHRRGRALHGGRARGRGRTGGGRTGGGDEGEGPDGALGHGHGRGGAGAEGGAEHGRDAGGGRERGYRGEQATPDRARGAFGTRHGRKGLPDRGRWIEGPAGEEGAATIRRVPAVRTEDSSQRRLHESDARNQCPVVLGPRRLRIRTHGDSQA